MLETGPWDTYQIGVDEVGRGCLWGPVYAAAVLLPEINPENPGLWGEVKDSKLISKKKREKLATFIRENALAWGIGSLTALEIDRMNILQASLMAMHEALDAAWAKHPFKSIAVDGTHFKPWITPSSRFTDEPESIGATCIAQGDASLLCVAAASILAKDARDRWVEEYIAQHPSVAIYGLKTNMGYGTPAHLKMLWEHGPHPLHRKTFRPVTECFL